MKDIKIKAVKPMFNRIVTTAEEWSVESATLKNGMIDPTKLTKGVRDIQKVIAVGTSVRGVNVGDYVQLDFTRYGKQKYSSESIKEQLEKQNPYVSFEIPTVEIDGEEYLSLFDSDIMFILTLEENGKK